MIYWSSQPGAISLFPVFLVLLQIDTPTVIPELFFQHDNIEIDD